MNTNCIDKQSQMARAKVGFGFFLPEAFEDIFKNTLIAYLKFAEETLHLTLPLRLMAGATKVEGYRMVAPQGMSFGFERFDGRVVEPHIVYEGIVENYQSEPAQILRPFFNRVWEECGLDRPDQDSL